MRIRTIALLLLVVLGLPRSVFGQTHEAERLDFGRYFREAGVHGTFVLYDVEGDRILVHNPARADSAFIPASTFKILNTMIALETGAVRDTSEVIAWDGVDRGIRPWNRDHNLASAFRHSVVWYYQELARRVGSAQMQRYVDAVGYGNTDLSGGIDQFWLTGGLRIRPHEQVAFLTRLHRGDLPFSERTMRLTKQVMTQEATDTYVLRGKTGWARWQPADVGWYVGYLERDGRVYVFANNIDICRPEDVDARVAVTRQILGHLGLLK